MKTLILGGRLPETGSALIDSIRFGDRVTTVDRFGVKHTGKAVMPSGDGLGWVLNMGGKHGTPGIASVSNTIRVLKRK